MPEPNQRYRLFSSSEEQILAECPKCGRVLKVAPATTTATTDGFSVVGGIRCPCGHMASEIFGTRPSPSQPADPKRSGGVSIGGCLGCLGIIVAIVLIGAIVNAIDEASERRAQHRAAEQNARSAAATRLADSTWAISAVNEKLGWSDLLRFESIVHDRPLLIQHDSLHSVANRMLLDSTDAAIRRKNFTHAREHWGRMKHPFTPAQESRRARLSAAIRKAEQQAEQAADQAIRRAYATTLRKKFLDEGLDIKVTTQGDAATTLKFEFVLFTDVWSHKLVTGEFLAQLRAMGFKRFRMTDGYDWGYYWNL